MLLLAVIVLPCAGWVPCSSSQAAEAETKPAPVDYVRDVQPLLAAHCYKCHGPQRQEGGLRLNTRASVFGTSDSGKPAVMPSDPAASRLVQLVSGKDPDLKMPPEDEGRPLSDAQVELLARWVSEGAAWPADADLPSAGSNHWAWHRPLKAVLPSVRNGDWPRGAIDYFVLVRLEKAGLAPAPEADRYTLARRVYLDLVGLPPTIDETDAFVNDDQPGAYERMVELALADPAYGERWARVWLDLARYADSKGYGSDPLRTIWRYRDWVIEAFNRNLPYDQFTIEQLAGDLLPAPTADQVLATAFHRNTMANDEGGTDDEEFRVAAVKDRVETTMQVWMGLTIGCAKCHSHKFDPITQREYYQAYAIFDSSEDADRGDEEPKVSSPTRLQQQQLAARRAQIAALETKLAATPTVLDAEILQWEKALAEQAAAWNILEPKKASTVDGSQLVSLDDRSVRASGRAPVRETYRVEFATDLKGVTALRLEALADVSLPGQGPGRAEGNFVLNEIRITAAPPSPRAPRGRFVRIEIPGEKKILSLAEVQIVHGSENLALQGKASQSSTLFAAGAELAIDNQTQGDFHQKSVTHTNEEANPWWEFDLGRSEELDRLAIWNRTDGGLESRLKDFRVSVLDENHKPIWQRTIAEPPKPSVQIDLAQPAQLELAGATADFAQTDWPVAAAIDGDASEESGWAINPRAGKSHYAVFRFKSPPAFDGPMTLGVTLVQSHGHGHTLGRFRVSVTTAATPPTALPQDVGEILAIAPTARSADQRTKLSQYYFRQSPAASTLGTQIAELTAQIKDIEKQVATTPIMRELAADKRRVTHTMVKGNFRMPGDRVEPAVPSAFHPLGGNAPPDRLALARWLVDRENPLTARMAVNRLWAQVFGAGIVATEEDFGTQGLPPTHPEVLDWLAVDLMDRGWDLKDMLREIVTSATYRQSSSPTSEVLQKDPNNRLLAHGPRFRLEAEMVRDQALALGGLLSRKQGGESVYPPQPPGLWRAAFNGQRTWATSGGEDRYRRGLYTFWRRTVPYPSMSAFDAPSREICTLRRVATNTPLQALVTLNDPVFVEAAQGLARRIVAEGGPNPTERGAFALRLALGRPPQAEQVVRLVELYQSEVAHYQQDAKAALALATEPLGPPPAGCNVEELAAWTVVANVILNLDGVLTKR